ncbi:hypothetical protein GGR53DRAFT_533079 [Hypoxylon sp. FL1150]|nr:hypothetical protein GGR53DRAFT_533079 [Hypoxylon sp. FL1150]
MSEQSPAASDMTRTLSHTPTISLSKSSQFRERDIQRGVPNLDGNMSSEPRDTECEEQLREVSLLCEYNVFAAHNCKGACYSKLIPPVWPLKSSSRIALESEQPTAHRSGMTEDGHSTRPGTKLGSTIGWTGKVSDLRRVFERSTTPGASPRSIKSFWRNRGRTKPAARVERSPVGEPSTASSLTIPDEPITPVRRIPMPELTTEISTDDFSCDFVGGPGNNRPTTPKPQLETAAENDTPNQHESPVKARIQRFEQLEHDSPVASLASCHRANSFEPSLHTSIRERENITKRIKPQASWHPFRQRSVELWRRISNSFNRSVDNRNDSSDGGEQDNSSTHVGTNTTQQGSVRRRPGHRRSNLFGHHLYRTSEFVRSSVELSHSDPRLSINDELMERFENRPPHLTYTGSISGRLSMRKTFPFLSRMSNDLGCADEFDGVGLDGSVASKVSRFRDKSPTGEASQAAHPTTSTSATRGDPNALSKIVSKQTTAERKLRRIEEKQLRKEQRDKKREKTKETGHEEGSGNNGTDKGDVGANKNAQNKGKGKEVAGKEKKESSWSKKTASGFVVRQINDIKLKHPKPRRPGQVKKIVNMYKEKASSGIKLGKGSGASTASGSTAAKPETTDKH